MEKFFCKRLLCLKACKGKRIRIYKAFVLIFLCTKDSVFKNFLRKSFCVQKRLREKASVRKTFGGLM